MGRSSSGRRGISTGSDAGKFSPDENPSLQVRLVAGSRLRLAFRAGRRVSPLAAVSRGQWFRPCGRRQAADEDWPRRRRGVERGGAVVTLVAVRVGRADFCHDFRGAEPRGALLRACDGNVALDAGVHTGARGRVSSLRRQPGRLHARDGRAARCELLRIVRARVPRFRGQGTVAASAAGGRILRPVWLGRVADYRGAYGCFESRSIPLLVAARAGSRERRPAVGNSAAGGGRQFRFARALAKQRRG